MTEPVQVRVAALTHHGRVRDHNEDTIAVGDWVRNAPMDGPRLSVHDLDKPVLCLVADGMGGHAAGEDASREAAFQMVREAPHLADEESIAALLRRLNRRIFELMNQDPGKLGMGTTVAGLLIAPDRILHFNVGDSRIYRQQSNFLRQLSVDDVPTTEAVGTYAPDEGLAGKRRSHTVTQALGGAREYLEIVPHVGAEPFEIGRRYLLCSDGLTDMVDLDTIEACMAADDAAAVTALFERALAAGGEDNVSVMIVQIAAAAGGRHGTPGGVSDDGNDAAG